jgi:hypothetical protein
MNLTGTILAKCFSKLERLKIIVYFSESHSQEVFHKKFAQILVFQFS